MGRHSRSRRRSVIIARHRAAVPVDRSIYDLIDVDDVDTLWHFDERLSSLLRAFVADELSDRDLALGYSDDPDRVLGRTVLGIPRHGGHRHVADVEWVTAVLRHPDHVHRAVVPRRDARWFFHHYHGGPRPRE